MEQFESRYFRGQGAVFLGDIDASGNPTNLLFIGDVSEAELTPDVSKVEIIENVTGNGNVGASWHNQVKYNFRMVCKSTKDSHLAEILQASNTAKAAGSVSAEAHTAKLGRFSVMDHTKISNVVVTGSGGTPTYVLDTDYVVHADKGMVEWLSGGTVSDAEAVEIDYDYADQHHISADPGNTVKSLVFAGKNSADSDKQVRCEVYQINIDPGALGMIQASQGAEVPVTGLVQLATARAAGDQLFAWKTED